MFLIAVAAKTKDLGGYRHPRAHVARVSYLIWIRAADKFDMRARTARVASWVRNIKTYCLSYESASARAMRV